MTLRIYDNSIGEYDNYKKLGYLRMSKSIVSKGLLPEDTQKCGRCNKPILDSFGYRPRELVSICGPCVNEEYRGFAAQARVRREIEQMYERLFKGRY